MDTIIAGEDLAKIDEAASKNYPAIKIAPHHLETVYDASGTAIDIKLDGVSEMTPTIALEDDSASNWTVEYDSAAGTEGGTAIVVKPRLLHKPTEGETISFTMSVEMPSGIELTTNIITLTYGDPDATGTNSLYIPTS